MIATSPGHYRLLGLKRGCTMPDVRAAYRVLAKKNHPDLFPDREREKQMLRMMRINEAYMAVLAELTEGGPNHGRQDEPSADAAGQGDSAGGASTARSSAPGAAPESFFRAWEEKAAPGQPSEGRAVGQLRDPAYAYYKQGFTYYRLGATELFRKDAPTLRRYLQQEGSADAYILRLAMRALHYFERAYSYFLVVVQEYGTSPWAPDARWKLRRLEKFSAIYSRICENLSRRSSTRRSSFSTVNGADPS
jgi:curved DNA-binding protein CbpA